LQRTKVYQWSPKSWNFCLSVASEISEGGRIISIKLDPVSNVSGARAGIKRMVQDQYAAQVLHRTSITVKKLSM